MTKKALLEVEIMPGVSVTVSDDLALKAFEKFLEIVEKGEKKRDVANQEMMTDAGRRERDKATVEREHRNDPGNAELKPDDPRRCAYPAARYGWDGDPLNRKPTDRAVCSICCPYNLTCPVKHRTFDDINNPRDARTPPVEGKSDHPEN